MEIIKRKILLEDSTDRRDYSPTWGSLTASTFYINIFLTQNIDNIGIFTDIDYTESLINDAPEKPYSPNELLTLRDPIKTLSDYNTGTNPFMSGLTDSKLSDVRSYNINNPYRTNFNVNTQTYYNYEGKLINGVSRIKTMGDESVYVFDAIDDSTLGTVNQKTGLRYTDYSGQSRNTIIENQRVSIPVTTVNYVGEGINNSNSVLSALTKEEYLLGVVSKPSVESDIFIERGNTSVMDKHLRLSEIKTLDELNRYGNSFYQLKKQ